MTPTSWTHEHQEALATKLAPFAIDGLGLAVSGGSDSLAMLYLIADWASEAGVTVKVATVDHGLRAEAKDEAKLVAEHCRTLGVPHSTLEWRGWDGTGNLQSMARKARISLLADWAKDVDVSRVALAHTMDDVAETFLMRLGRGAGAAGLAKMTESRDVSGVEFIRPLMAFRRSELRAYLQERDAAWVEDPSNQDDRFDRVRLRKMLPDLESAGVNVTSIAKSAENLRGVSEALDHYTRTAAEDAVTIEDCNLWLDLARLTQHPAEIQRRLISGAVEWMSPFEYAPRGKSVQRVLAQLKEQEQTVLRGCLFVRVGERVLVTREFAAVEGLSVAVGEVWDGRWLLRGIVADGAEVRALGSDGLQLCPDWRETGRKRAALLVSPSVWVSGELVSAPLVGKANAITAEPQKHWEDFLQTALSH
ncbi:MULTISPECIES: tRNA lysidine(34) synthetase TilS [Halocynthiibacter]|uniref:tRNA(Ile)-lysidine synthase n=1 Tax=Halocynthiibacter halioticoli TaxID=2986804 RepID=A0AAE3J0U9_9RHOB|nr:MULTISPECIES: tRNA lysidine(34) synthetase TilS [Halocynthiibacter]MCV6825289.1 tRNA lysidine(34) synthetase TilS [Halocynthiibacter halioticoli]MCW4058290.1 tRNA lysidine(34) synthetase TilS [Halocynthiibacter sp. SDUM655004]